MEESHADDSLLNLRKLRAGVYRLSGGGGDTLGIGEDEAQISRAPVPKVYDPRAWAPELPI